MIKFVVSKNKKDIIKFAEISKAKINQNNEIVFPYFHKFDLECKKFQDRVEIFNIIFDISSDDGENLILQRRGD